MIKIKPKVVSVAVTAARSFQLVLVWLVGALIALWSTVRVVAG